MVSYDWHENQSIVIWVLYPTSVYFGEHDILLINSKEFLWSIYRINFFGLWPSYFSRIGFPNSGYLLSKGPSFIFRWARGQPATKCFSMPYWMSISIYSFRLKQSSVLWPWSLCNQQYILWDLFLGGLKLLKPSQWRIILYIHEDLFKGWVKGRCRLKRIALVSQLPLVWSLN